MARPMDMPTATVPVAILTALSRAINGWTAEVYPGATAALEVARRASAARHLHTWHATARLSNGVRLRFTLVVRADGVAFVTRHARLASGDTDARTPAISAPLRRDGRRPPDDRAHRS